METRRLAYGALLAALYVVVGQVVQFIPNPMVPGAIIALNMTVVVIAGILLGPSSGALVGLVGTLVNAVVIQGTGKPFEFAAVVPHTIMGFTAGLVGRSSPYLASLTILIGHALNLLAFYLIGLMPASAVAATVFSVGLAAEAVIDIVVIVLAVALLRPVLRVRTA